MDDTILRGSLLNGKLWQVDFSRTSAIPDGRGKHFILTFTGDERPQDEIPMDERRELLGVAYEIASALAVSIGKFRIELNGPAAVSRPHFHIHIICPDADLKIRRIVDTIVAPTS